MRPFVSVVKFPELLQFVLFRVNWLGKILWQTPLLRTSTCAMDITFFPYDIQTCHLQLGSFSLLGNEVNLDFMKNVRGIFWAELHPLNILQ